MLGDGTYTRDPAQHKPDAAQDNYADEREADLPREHGDVVGLDMNSGEQREEVREADRDHVCTACGLCVGAV